MKARQQNGSLKRAGETTRAIETYSSGKSEGGGSSTGGQNRPGKLRLVGIDIEQLQRNQGSSRIRLEAVRSAPWLHGDDARRAFRNDPGLCATLLGYPRVLAAGA